MSCTACNQTDTREVCFSPTNTAVAPVTLLLHTKNGVDAAGAPLTVSYLSTADNQNTALDPATYLGGGTFSAGACPVAQPDVEFEQLCEKLADGSNKSFIRRSVTTFNALNQATTTVSNFELDKVTPYVVVSEANVGQCSCEPLVNTGLVTNISNFR